MLAGMTGLRRGIPAVNLDQSSSIPLGLIFQLAYKLAPADITNGLAQLGVLDYVLDCQTFYADDLIFVDHASRKFLLVVPSPVSNASMNTSHLPAGFLAVFPALLFPRIASLSLGQFLFIFGKIARIADLLPSGEDNQRRDAQIHANHLLHHGKRLNVLFNQNGDKVAIGAIFGNGDRTGLSILGKVSMPANSQRFSHLGKRQLTSIPRKGIRSIGSRLLLAFFLEGGIVSSSFKEVDKRSLQMAESLLQGNRGNISKPRILFLEIREHGCKIVVVEAQPVLEIGRPAGRESPIVDKADTAKRLS
jgi:hypothetical protein